MIAAATPDEYSSVGAKIRVHKVKEVSDGDLKILLHGDRADAEYIRGALNNQKGVETSAPEQVPGAVGVLMSFTAKSTGSDALTRAAALRILAADRYIEIMNGA